MKVEIKKLSILPNNSVLKMFIRELDGNIHLMGRCVFTYKIDEIITMFEEHNYKEYLSESFYIKEEIGEDLYGKALDNAKKQIKEVDTYLKSIGHITGETVIFEQG